MFIEVLSKDNQGAIACIFLSFSSESVQVSGFFSIRGELMPLDRLSIAGSSLAQVPMTNSLRYQTDVTKAIREAYGRGNPTARRLYIPEKVLIDGSEPHAWIQRSELWSRTMGAMGEETWERMVSLRYCIIGLGRTGSMVASSLVRQGVRHLTLVDPDVIELHNLDAMNEVTTSDVGKYKAESLGKYLKSLPTSPDIEVVVDSALNLNGLIAIKKAL